MTRIRYLPNWLQRYEFGLDADDAALKRAEAERLVAELRNAGLWGRIHGLLDVGTCTGRYPLLLREAVDAGGRIVGVDEDVCCLEFARGNVAGANGGGGADIVLLRADFTSPELALPHAPFDLVTCMMSTLSHFGHDRRASFDDTLQRVLERLAGLLAPGGLLAFTVWSQPALDGRRMLAIYDDGDRAKLAAWTPPAAELDTRLAAAGFARRERMELDERLDFWICARGAS